MKFAPFLLVLAASPALAYSGPELLADCQAAESFFADKKSSDPYQSVRGARCLAYVAGFPMATESPTFSRARWASS